MDKKYFVKIENEQVEVTKEVYLTYYGGERKRRYFEEDLKTNRVILDEDNRVERYIPAREESLEYLMDEKSMDFPDKTPTVEAQVLAHIDRDLVRQAIQQLKPSHQDLVYALFYEQQTETEYAEKIGIAQPTVNRTKKVVIKKLKKLLEKKL